MLATAADFSNEISAGGLANLSASLLTWRIKMRPFKAATKFWFFKLFCLSTHANLARFPNRATPDYPFPAHRFSKLWTKI